MYFYVGGSPIEFVELFAHLGRIITNRLIDNVDIMNRCNNFVGQVNSVSCFFRKLNASYRYKLFQSSCMSIYGSELWSLTNDKIDDLHAINCERVYAEYLVYRMTLIVIFFRYLVSACHCTTRFVAVH